MDRDLYTLVMSANDAHGDQVNVGITQLEHISTGSYSIAFEIEPVYNGFVTYSEDINGSQPIFGPVGGGNELSAVTSEMVSGSVDAQCRIPGQANLIRIKGTFKAIAD
ncbi:MAG TPA: hypothetical protein VKN36_04105 [Eudoraea sp.]|nr:hypothetical protein [Eudoraea sp.]